MPTMVQATCEFCGGGYSKMISQKDRQFCSTKCQYEARKLKVSGPTKCCSKCNRDLPLKKFWKSKIQASGYYPSCIECEKSHRRETINSNPMCFRCSFSKHTPKSPYCQDCERIIHKKPPRKWVSRRTGLESVNNFLLRKTTSTVHIADTSTANINGNRSVKKTGSTHRNIASVVLQGNTPLAFSQEGK